MICGATRWGRHADVPPAEVTVAEDSAGRFGAGSDGADDTGAGGGLAVDVLIRVHEDAVGPA